jgi:hypothetical protein
VLTLFHAFNMNFRYILRHLDELESLGFDGLQISPAQSSMKNDELWFHRYQPKDYSRLEGLGSDEDLKLLCTAADDRGLFVVADLVFNHMGPICSALEAQEAYQASLKGQHDPMTRIQSRLSTFSPLRSEDFHPLRPIGGFDYDNDELRFTGWGGDGTWPDLKPTKRVLAVQKAHIDLLYSCGVRGFRFDAVKQMFPDTQYAPLVAHCRSKPGVRLIYGEVLSLNEAQHTEYARHAWTTDFQLMHSLVQALEGDRDLSRLIAPSHIHADAIFFSRNHDTVLQNLDGLSFTEAGPAAIAGAYVLAFAPAVHQNSGVLVYKDDLLDKPGGPVNRCAMRLRQLMVASVRSGNALTTTRVQLKTLDGKVCTHVLWIQCGELGGMLLNASTEPIPLATLQDPSQPISRATPAPKEGERAPGLLRVCSSADPDQMLTVRCFPHHPIVHSLRDWVCPGYGVLVAIKDKSTNESR